MKHAKCLHRTEGGGYYAAHIAELKARNPGVSRFRLCSCGGWRAETPRERQISARILRLEERAQTLHDRRNELLSTADELRKRLNNETTDRRTE